MRVDWCVSSWLVSYQEYSLTHSLKGLSLMACAHSPRSHLLPPTHATAALLGTLLLRESENVCW